MQEALERERLQLEEVVKLEIKGRMASVEGLKGELRSSTVALKEKLTGWWYSTGISLAALFTASLNFNAVSIVLARFSIHL